MDMNSPLPKHAVSERRNDMPGVYFGATRECYRRCKPTKNMINMKPTTKSPVMSFRRSDTAGRTPSLNLVTVGAFG